MIMYDLIPDNGRKSFYGKAKVFYGKSRKYLQSYNTVVCSIKDNGQFEKYWKGYSNTTMNHINSFRRQNGLETLSKKQWEMIETKDFEMEGK